MELDRLRDKITKNTTMATDDLGGKEKVFQGY